MIDATIKRFISEIVIDKYEGVGGTAVANDSGGYTKYGIAQKYNPEVDVPKLTKDGAVAIYYAKYFLANGLDRLESKVSMYILDSVINMGDAYLKLVQKEFGLTADGVVGPATASKLNSLDSDYLMDKLLKLRVMHYSRIVKSKPTQSVFIEGWVRRAFEIYEDIYYLKSR